jgi:hypothetical protein
MARSPDPPTGADFGWFRRRSNSGKVGPAGCTTAYATSGASNRNGLPKGSRLEAGPERAGHHEHDPNGEPKASISAELAESFEVERPELADPGVEAQTASDAGQFRGATRRNVA